MLERDVAAYLKKRIKALGGDYRRVQWTGRVGAPDILVLLPVPPTLWNDTPAWQHPMVETKAPGQVPEEHQLREHERLRAAGFVVLVIDSCELVDRYFPL